MSPLPLNPALERLPVYQPGRPIEEVARELGLPAGDIIKLASNENPLGPSRLALGAMRKALAQVNLYPDGNAFYLKNKLAEKLGVEPGHLILGNGSNEIIEFVGHALLRPGGRLVLKEAEDDGSWRVKKALWQEQLMVRLLRRTHSSGAVGFAPRATLEAAVRGAGFAIEEVVSLARGYSTPHLLIAARAR